MAVPVPVAMPMPVPVSVAMPAVSVMPLRPFVPVTIISHLDRL